METAGETEINRRRGGDGKSPKSAEETARKQTSYSYLGPKVCVCGGEILTFTRLSSTSGLLESVINSRVSAEEANGPDSLQLWSSFFGNIHQRAACG